MTALRKAPVRLALRREGEYVNAYVAHTDTMDGAMHLGSLHGTLAENSDLWEAWKGLMTQAMSHLIERALGIKPDAMIERPAPESERSGRA